MSDGDFIEISIERIIPAEKWRVIRQITKVWEFPSYVPTVQKVSVLGKAGNKIRTEWHIEVGRVPIRWVEEEILALDEGSIYFRLLEGDLQNFEGQWSFAGHSEGTQVKVSLRLKFDIPGIRDFAREHIKKVVAGNFESILDGLERRLISTRYASLRRGDTDKVAGAGIIWHFYNIKHFERCLKMLDPGFQPPSSEFLSHLFHISPSFKVYDIMDFESITGVSTYGSLILATVVPDMVDKDPYAVFSKVVKACKIAEKHGVGIVVLGGFTSIVEERIGREVSKEVDVPVTTGRTFTAAMVLDGVFSAVEKLGRDISSLEAAVIGGTGDIGSGCARVLVDKVKKLTVTGRDKKRLKLFAGELKRKRKAAIDFTTDNRTAVEEADIVICAASASSAVIDIDWFKPGAVVCDTGYPKNVSVSGSGREDVLVFSGGLAVSPEPVDFPVDIGLPSKDVVYGCFAEAMILALEHRYETYSFGRGNITPERIDEIRRLGAKHGFSVSSLWWENKLIDDKIISKVRDAGTVAGDNPTG